MTMNKAKKPLCAGFITLTQTGQHIFICLFTYIKQHKKKIEQETNVCRINARSRKEIQTIYKKLNNTAFK